MSWKASLNGKDIIKKIVFNELDKNKSNISTYKKIPETKMINVYQPDINSNDKKYVISALNNSNLSGASPEVKEFENKFASKFNFKYCLAVNNGTAALHLALMALGIQRDDEVIIPSLSFIATANAVSYVGAKPVIVDVNPNTFQISAEEIENNSNQLLNYTNIIKENSVEIKKDIIEHLWKVIISDNTVDQYESNLMRRICGLIYFPDKECAEIKLKLINSK